MCFREPVGGANRQQAPLNYSLELSGGTTSAFRLFSSPGPGASPLWQ